MLDRATCRHKPHRAGHALASSTEAAMSRSRYAPDRRGRLLLILALASSLLVVAPPVGRAASGDVVISQVFGGGSGAGMPPRDFVELVNLGVAPVSLGGWSVQYA